MERAIQFGCCFCGEAVDIGMEFGGFGLALVDTNGDFLEQWWCHGHCLGELMLPTPREASPFLPQITSD